MIRTVIENMLLFLLPTFVYVAWVLFQSSRAEAEGENENAEAKTGHPIVRALDDAPLLWLFAGGALILIVTLAFFGTSSGGKPGQHYQPSIMKDGKIQPSHIE
ncbi:hypothetical protein [Hyphomicrobium sp. CS1GBMeth3]|uniref:hypothetical protein n=1 Tax=Hyphomicrobium sp. CS1GBMeth3 TaxID=1892845 RepID=UPI000931AE38|nr:hypothetical protein [Hyphomicrobium sp. CS1GBMeth3]